MSNLISLNDANLFRESVLCQSCRILQLMNHTSDVFILEDDRFVEYNFENVDVDCMLTKRLLMGTKLREEDYDDLSACSEYVKKEKWLGVTMAVANTTGALVEYLKLSIGLELDIATVYKAVTEIGVITINEVPEDFNPTLETQFSNEYYNYDLFRGVREGVRETIDANA